MTLTERSKGKLKFDSKYLNKCSEIELFIQVNCYHELLRLIKLVEYYNKMYQLYLKQQDFNLANHFKELERINSIMLKSRFSDKTPSKDELKEFEDTLDYCILQTARFNTGVCDNPNGRIEITNNFENWYYSWMFYIENMDEETLQVYRKCRYEGKGLEQFRLNQPVLLTNIEDTINSPKIKQYHFHGSKKNIRQKLA